MSESTPPDGHKLTDAQWFTLRAVADVIVPPSQTYEVPGAGDESVCKNVIKDADRRLGRLIDALDTLNEMAEQGSQCTFAELDSADREPLALTFRDAHPRAAQLLETLVTQCYYRDDRVLRSLGMEARPPFPQGYPVDNGDWSSLEPVRARPPLYRPTD